MFANSFNEGNILISKSKSSNLFSSLFFCSFLREGIVINIFFIFSCLNTFLNFSKSIILIELIELFINFLLSSKKYTILKLSLKFND